jgi:hypothetical protein
MAVLTGPLFSLVSGIVKEDFTHQRRRELLELSRVTGFADFVADVSGGGLLWRFLFRRPSDLEMTQEESVKHTQSDAPLHVSSGDFLKRRLLADCKTEFFSNPLDLTD